MILLLIFSSCNDNPAGNNNSENNFKYPYDVNTFWYYGTRNFTTNYRPDSLIAYFPTDTLIGTGGALFLKDTVINQDTLRLLRNSHSEIGHSHTTLELYKQTDTGLIRAAFYSDGVNFCPFASNSNSVTLSFNGKSYNSLSELFNYYKYDMRDAFDDTTLYFDDPRITSIKYPLVLGNEWHFTTVGTTKMTKKYISYETVNSMSGNHYCVKIQKQWYNNGSATPDSHLIFYDYFSKEGLIKRDFTIKDIAINNSTGQLLGYIDAKDEGFLNFYTHP